MNILFVYERMIIPTFGGLERVTHILAKEFSKRNHNIYYLSVGSLNINSEQIESDFPQFYLPISDIDFETFRSQYTKLLHEKSIDVIIFQGQQEEVLKTMGIQDINVKKISVLHFQPFGILHKERKVKSLTPWKNLTPKGKMLKLLALTAPKIFRNLYINKVSRNYEFINKNADYFVLLSEKFIPDLINNYKSFEKEKIKTINNPLTFIPPTFINHEKKENLIVFVSRLTNPQKNVTGFIDVWNIFSKTHPDWKAKIIGDGEDRKYLEEYANKTRSKNLTFEGNQKNVENYYIKAKIYCMTSTYEGWGMVLTEAMAYGCVPVAFSSYGSIKDIISDFKTGILIEPFDTKKMASSLTLLADNDEMRVKMASAGFEKLENFKVEKIADQWEKIIRKQ